MSLSRVFGEPLELNFTNPLESVTELIVLGERMSSVTVDKYGVVGKMFKKGQFCSATNYQSYPSAQISVPGFVPFRLCSNS